MKRIGLNTLHSTFFETRLLNVCIITGKTGSIRDKTFIKTNASKHALFKSGFSGYTLILSVSIILHFPAARKAINFDPASN